MTGASRHELHQGTCSAPSPRLRELRPYARATSSKPPPLRPRPPRPRRSSRSSSALPAIGTGLAHAGAGLAFAAGKVVGIPGAIARSILPAGEPTAAQVADAAVANDSAAQASPRSKQPTFGGLVQRTAVRLLERDETEIERLTPHVTGLVMDWLRGLSSGQLLIVKSLDRASIEEHVMLPGTQTVGLPRFDQAKAESTMTPEERRRSSPAATASLRTPRLITKKRQSGGVSRPTAPWPRAPHPAGDHEAVLRLRHVNTRPRVNSETTKARLTGGPFLCAVRDSGSDAEQTPGDRW